MGPALAIPLVINGVALSTFATVPGAIVATAAIVAVAAIPGAAQAVNKGQNDAANAQREQRLRGTA